MLERFYALAIIISLFECTDHHVFIKYQYKVKTKVKSVMLIVVYFINTDNARTDIYLFYTQKSYLQI